MIFAGIFAGRVLVRVSRDVLSTTEDITDALIASRVNQGKKNKKTSSKVWRLGVQLGVIRRVKPQPYGQTFGR